MTKTNQSAIVAPTDEAHESHETSKILRLERRVKNLKKQVERLKIQAIIEKQSFNQTKKILGMETESKYMLAMYVLERNHLDDLKEWFEKGRTYPGNWKENCIRHVRENLSYVNIVEIVNKPQPTQNQISHE